MLRCDTDLFYLYGETAAHFCELLFLHRLHKLIICQDIEPPQQEKESSSYAWE